MAAFLGQWGDCSTAWGHGWGTGRYYALFVTSVSPNGAADIVTVLSGALGDLPEVKPYRVRIDGNRFEYRDTSGMRMFNRRGDTLYGSFVETTLMFPTQISLVKQ